MNTSATARGFGIATASVTLLLTNGCKTESHDPASVHGNVAASASAAPLPKTPEQVVDAFYGALKKGEFKRAHGFFSEYSTKHFDVDVAQEIKNRERKLFAGTKTVDFKVVEKRELEPRTVLVEAWVKEQTHDQPPQTNEMTLVLRNENDSWRINYNSLVAYQTLNVTPQIKNEVSLQPYLIERYLDNIKLHFIVKNGSQKDKVHWGFPGDRTAVIEYPSGKSTVMENTHFKFEQGQSDDIWIKFDGYVSEFPRKIKSQRWARGMRFSRGELPGDSHWDYEFDLGTPADRGQSTK
jgi:hypothetical protein